MEKKKHEINQATLRYICACGHDNDWRSLRNTGFGRVEIDALKDLSFDEMRLLEREVEVLEFSQPKASLGAFWEAMRRMRAKSNASQARNELITRNAPADMMRELYGIGAKEYARLRRALNVSTGVGRPAVVDDEEITGKIWNALESICSDAAHLKPTQPEQWVQLCKESGVDIRVIWSVIKQYSSNPAPPPDSPPGSPVNNDTKQDEFSSNSRRRSA